MESGNFLNIQALAELLQEKDSDSDPEEGHPRTSSLHPGTIGSRKEENQFSSNSGHVWKLVQEDNETIWGPGEVPGVTAMQIPDISNDPRQRPEVELKYMQDVTPEDVFLGMSGITPGSGSCDWIVVRIGLTGESDHRTFHLDLKENWIEFRSKIYALVHVLPHRINPRLGNAKWDQDKATLTLTLKIIRDLDHLSRY